MPENPLTTIMKIDPVFVSHLKATDDITYSDGALSRKVKLLMAMAFDAANGAADGVTFLARSAMKEGATKEEIAEAIRVAVHLAGVGCAYVASHALKELFP